MTRRSKGNLWVRGRDKGREGVMKGSRVTSEDELVVRVRRSRSQRRGYGGQEVEQWARWSRSGKVGENGKEV